MQYTNPDWKIHDISGNVFLLNETASPEALWPSLQIGDRLQSTILDSYHLKAE